MKTIFGLAALGVLALAFAATSASAAEEAATKEMKGSAGCMGCAFKAGGCCSAVKIGDTVYKLTASEKADEATQKLIKSFKGNGTPVEVTVKGVVKENIIVADSVEAVAPKKG